MNRPYRLPVLMAFVLLVARSHATAQSYGLGDQVLTLGAAEFHPEGDDYSFTTGPTDGYLYGLAGHMASLRLPDGAEISPPGTPTFNHLPANDPAFQYIEALVASGIASGCSSSPPGYCPDASLTRRQMAVFRSKALGLHWTN